MKKALKKAMKKPKEKREECKGRKVTPRHPQPDAQTVFQVPANLTPRPWIKRKRKEVGNEEEVAQGGGGTRRRWHAGSGATRTTQKASQFNLSGLSS